jgi:AcrR family transcriptional regulator
MARWEPDSRERLARAAMELFAERGFDNTTVSEIAERAGLTERTFFRHFADKREVLFGGTEQFEERFVGPVAGAPESLAPIDAVALGLQGAAAMLQERRDFSRQRQAIINAHPELQERELIKMASLADALAGALRQRGVDEATASLTAQVGVAVFRAAFERWIDKRNTQKLSEVIQESLDQLSALAGNR